MPTPQRAIAAEASPAIRAVPARIMMATATAALIAMAAPQAFAQTQDDTTGSEMGDGASATDGGTSTGSVTTDDSGMADGGMSDGSGEGDAQVGGQPIEEAIEEADAPDTGESDAEGQTSAQGQDTAQSQSGVQDRPGSQMQGGQGMQPGQARGMTRENAGQTVMLDIEGFTETIYDRGYRQGYIRGMADARQGFIQQMRDRHMQQGMQHGDMGGEYMRDMPGDGPASGQQRPMPRSGQSGGGGDRGAIIVLPQGVSPQAFVDRLMQENEQMSGGN
ncbi:hypothetical protein [Tranquillimonas rosea]|uniref:hypothetical protein n=1 Tax=Tranquillimonas rosea TaxID=641238 RepID=UPI003BAD2386